MEKFDTEIWDKLRSLTFDGLKLMLKPIDGPECKMDYEIIDMRENKILSVKRLSDGEKFSVGDKVDSGTIKEATISMLWVCKDKLLVNSEPFYLNRELKDISHSCRALFVTVDGKEVFEGNTICYVNNKFEVYPMTITKDTYTGNSERCFSNQEAADNFILENKQCLSIADIKKNSNPSQIGVTSTSKEPYLHRVIVDILELKKLAKSKQ